MSVEISAENRQEYQAWTPVEEDLEGLPVVPEKLRTLDHGRPWSDDQFASTRLSSSRDMSR